MCFELCLNIHTFLFNSYFLSFNPKLHPWFFQIFCNPHFSFWFFFLCLLTHHPSDLFIGFLFFISLCLYLTWSGLSGGSGAVPEEWGLYPSSSSCSFSSSSTALCYLLQTEGDPSAGSAWCEHTCSFMTSMLLVRFCCVALSLTNVLKALSLHPRSTEKEQTAVWALVLQLIAF